ncbi:MAG TPA: 1-acyl-sn-glycerol-3-phosphate acyltransferase, partial [Gammaproteobacteria bacterium]|nr:1-acyl-sn-glycerol-3-phosphate acyltransferase [Gammaproteobacteria bacterium]
GGWLTSFYSAIPVVIMSPLAFLSRPERWLWAIHYYKATLSAAPNFAYELCVKKIQEDKIKEMDLSSWRLSFNGAEAVNPATLERFYKKFAPYGLKNTMIFPAYGLAESTVALILPKPHQEPQIDSIDKEIFETEHKAVPVHDPKTPKLSFVSVGSPIPQHQVKIVDDNYHEVADRTVGRLLFKGPSMMQGYYKNETATEKIKIEDWLDSGDYAYKDDNSYYITGRRKDLIIKAGRNFYPEEIEKIVSQISGIRQGCVAAFGAIDFTLSTEKLVIVAETKETKKKFHADIIDEVQEQVTSALGVPPDDVILVSPGSIPKTSSGKLQRARCKQLYETKRLSAPKVPVWLQFVKLNIRALFYKIRNYFYLFSQILYTGYVFFLTLLYIPMLTLLLWCMPKQFKRTFAKRAARIGLYISCLPIFVKNAQKWPKKGAHVYVVNHASYLDAVVLLATLPQNVLLVGKKEIMKMPLVGKLAQAVGILTVDRYDFSKNLEDTKKIENAVLTGQSIAIFPEGTFSYVEGLRSFKLGAFRIAVDTGTPICPLVIRGTRKIFRGKQWLLTPGKIEVEIGSTIVPQSKDWSEVTRLHSEAKAFIATNCGEPLVEF